MLPSDAITPWHYLVAAHEDDRHRDQARRHAHRRAMLEAAPARPLRPARTRRPAGSPRPSPLAWLRAAILDMGRQDHGLTDYPCRLPDGTIGRVSVIEVDGEWTAVCRVSRDSRVAGDRVVPEAI